MCMGLRIRNRRQNLVTGVILAGHAILFHAQPHPNPQTMVGVKLMAIRGTSFRATEIRKTPKTSEKKRTRGPVKCAK